MARRPELLRQIVEQKSMRPAFHESSLFVQGNWEGLYSADRVRVELEKLLKKCPGVASVKVLPGQSRARTGHQQTASNRGFINFEDPGHAKQCLIALKPTASIFGKPIKLTYSLKDTTMKDNERVREMLTVVVRNVPKVTKQQDLENQFEAAFGQVLRVYVSPHRGESDSNGRALVQFIDKSSAEAALAAGASQSVKIHDVVVSLEPYKHFNRRPLASQQLEAAQSPNRYIEEPAESLQPASANSPQERESNKGLVRDIAAPDMEMSSVLPDPMADPASVPAREPVLKETAGTGDMDATVVNGSQMPPKHPPKVSASPGPKTDAAQVQKAATPAPVRVKPVNHSSTENALPRILPVVQPRPPTNGTQPTAPETPSPNDPTHPVPPGPRTVPVPAGPPPYPMHYSLHGSQHMVPVMMQPAPHGHAMIPRLLSPAHMFRSQSGISDEQQTLFCCPITHELYRDPVSAPDGHIYERTAIEDWLQNGAVSPFTSEPMKLEDLRPVSGFGEALKLVHALVEDIGTLAERINLMHSVANQPLPMPRCTQLHG